MQFREVTWSQQLYFQRLLHGAGAEVTERSLPNYPGSALREIIRSSGHPHNVEPLLLTLRRPANAATRRRFAEVGGELVLIQKVTSRAPVATDFKMAVHGRIVDAPDGILYPTQDATTTYETWLRVEMLDILRLMVEENLVASLLPEMQAKLIADMQALAEDAAAHELLRLYAFAVAAAALKRFHAARPVALRAGLGPAAPAAFLADVLDQAEAGPEGGLYRRDPFELLKGLAAGVEALYLAACCGKQGEYSLAGGGGGVSGDKALQAAAAAAGEGPAAAAAAAVAAGAPALGGACERSLPGLADMAAARPELAALLARTVTKLWQLLQDREAFEYHPPAAAAAAANGDSNGDSNGNSKGKERDGDKKGNEGEDEDEGELTEEQRKLKAAAEEAVAASNLSFDENWQLFLKSVYDTDLVPLLGGAALQLGCCLLQELAHASRGEGKPVVLPDRQVLLGMAGHKQPLLALTGSALAAMADPASGEGGASSNGSSGSGSSTTTTTNGSPVPAILGLPGHQEVELSVLARSCFACNKPEGGEVKLLRCSQCGLVYYCSSVCQRADWKLGHKALCPSFAEWRAASGTSNGASNGSNGDAAS